MSIYVHILDQAKEDCKRQGVDPEKLEELKNAVEKDQSLQLFDRHNPYPCLIRRKFHKRNLRLIACQIDLGNKATVVVLLSLLVRGSNEYETHFANVKSRSDMAAYLRAKIEKEIPEDQLEEIINKRREAEPIPELNELTESESSFLWDSPQSVSGKEKDSYILETHEFHKDLTQKKIKSSHIVIPEMILEAVQGESDEILQIQKKGLVLLAINSSKNQEKESQCVLLQVLSSDKPEVITEHLNDWEQRLNGVEANERGRLCRTAYPWWICIDDNLWIEIHNPDSDPDGIANLSLSPEETRVLEDAEKIEGDSSGKPLFINGRAGSGKSTLLQYLFVVSFKNWNKHLSLQSGKNYPIYLASNKKLLENANKVASALLQNRSEEKESNYQFDAASLENCFKQTTDFLLSCLPDGEKKKFFPKNRVDYFRFKKMWEESFSNDSKARKNYGPQLSWHIIRGLIKGLSPEGYLDRDEYEDLPGAEKSVSKEGYERVFDVVWKWYENKCKEEQLWDDQDLVRHLLEKSLFPKSHCAVFCDEAQDFTRLELDAFYECSVYSDRKIYKQSVKKLPFVFAGDPFQTLNPTGFRWESVQAAFTERLMETLYRFDRPESNPTLHYRELTFNYRSAQPIVQFCNSIQACRAVLFDHKKLEPQKSWKIEDDKKSTPVFLDKGSPRIKQAIKEQVDLQIIIPCESGEEVDYVSNDEYLNEVITRDENGIPRNVHSATRSKGLEFKRVVLYGWAAESESKMIDQAFNRSNKEGLTGDEILPLEYFMNNLYVAASRAQNRLFVIDEKESLNELWVIVKDKERLWGKLDDHNADWATDDLGTIISGDLDSNAEEAESAAVQAEQFEEEGLAKKDSFMLRQAAMYWELEKNHHRKDRCRGHANLIDERYGAAAKDFENAGEYVDAAKSLWHEGNFKEINELSKRHPVIAHQPVCRTALYLEDDESNLSECSELLVSYFNKSEFGEEWRVDLGDSLWRKSIEKVVGKAIADLKKNVSVDREKLAGQIALNLEQLFKIGLELPDIVVAEVDYEAGNYNAVLKRMKGAENSIVYRNASAQLLKEKYEDGEILKPEQLESLGDFLFEQKGEIDFDQVSSMYLKSGNSDKVINILRIVVADQNLSESQILKVVANAILISINFKKWADVGNLARFGVTKSLKSSRRRKDLKQMVEGSEIQSRLIEYLAVSDELSSDISSTKQVIVDFLREFQTGTNSRAVSPVALGAAIERAGNLSDALKFYERLRGKGHPSLLQQYAETRWITCKLREADDQTKKGRTGWAQKNITLAKDRADIHGWRIEDFSKDSDPFYKTSGIEDFIPNYSNTIKEAVSGKQLENGNRVKLGGVELRFIESVQRINLESMDDGQQASIKCAEGVIDSTDDLFVMIEEGLFRSEKWEIEVAWLEEGVVKVSNKGDEYYCNFVLSG